MSISFKRSGTSLINTLVFQKLITIMSSVVDACAMSNNSLVVNRLDGASATADLMLEFALERTAARPTVERFEKYCTVCV